MQIENEIGAFGKASERLLASIAIHRPLTKEEALFVKHYCRELMEKVASTSPTNLNAT